MDRSSTELPRDFCAGIGLLQLDVVLVLIIFHYFHHVFISMTMCARVVGPSCAGYSHSGIDRGHN